jgi:hypothetical protein
MYGFYLVFGLEIDFLSSWKFQIDYATSFGVSGTLAGAAIVDPSYGRFRTGLKYAIGKNITIGTELHLRRITAPLTNTSLSIGSVESAMQINGLIEFNF